MATLEIYWSFRSPYSYLATARLLEIKSTYALDVDFRPVRPLALREPDFFSRGRKQFVPYLLKDVFREAQRMNIVIQWPNPDPVKMDLVSGSVDPAQPIMVRLMSLGIAAVVAGQGIEFATNVSQSTWTGVEGWHEDDALGEAARRAGLDLVELDRWIEANPKKIAEMIAHNEAAQLVHHWGVPLMVLDGEPFFGQDRLDALVWRLDQRGLKKAD